MPTLRQSITLRRRFFSSMSSQVRTAHPFRQGTGYVHLRIFGDDGRKARLRHLFDDGQGLEIQTVGETEISLGDVHFPYLTVKIVQTAKQTGMDLLQARVMPISCHLWRHFQTGGRCPDCVRRYPYILFVVQVWHACAGMQRPARAAVFPTSSAAVRSPRYASRRQEPTVHSSGH